MKKKLVLSSLSAVVLAIVVYGVLARSASRKYDFRFDEVTVGDLNAYVTASGTVNPVTSVDVGTQVSGVVAKLYADFNSVVKKGELIAQIDSTFLAQAVKDAEASMEKAKAQYADSKRNLEREKALLDRKLDSQFSYDSVLTTEESNAAALKSAEAALEGAKINLAYATIAAPISGVVINRAVSVGQTVAASYSSPTLFTIANDLTKMQVLATVDESDIGTISIGQEATFTVDAYSDQTFRGSISQIRLEPQSIQNVVNYTVVIDVNNDRLQLMPGMTANVKILVADAHNVLRVPSMALRFQPPPELIDTSKAIPRTDPLAMVNLGGGGGIPAGAPSADPPGQVTDSGTAHRQGRQSETPLHGSEMAGSAARGLPIAPAQNSRKATGGEAFGITLRFPEYEKSAYVPVHQAGRGRVWVVDAKGMVTPVFVWTGTTDGRYTEVTSPELKPGQQIVLGVNTKSDAANAARSPLTGGSLQRPGGGGPR